MSRHNWTGRQGLIMVPHSPFSTENTRGFSLWFWSNQKQNSLVVVLIGVTYVWASVSFSLLLMDLSSLRRDPSHVQWSLTDRNQHNASLWCILKLQINRRKSIRNHDPIAACILRMGFKPESWKWVESYIRHLYRTSKGFIGHPLELEDDDTSKRRTLKGKTSKPKRK